MKKAIQILFLILLTLNLTACDGEEPDQEPTAVISMDDIHTAVVITLTAEAAKFSPTPEPTQTQASTNTPVPSETPMQNTPTLKTLNNVVATTSSNTANGCYDAAYVSDVTIPDGTEFAPGESFTKTWSLSNTGTCNWEEDFQLVFISGEDMDGEDTEIGDIVYVGYSDSISVAMVAPSTNGTYFGYWRMVDASGNLFGGSIYVKIVVTDDASTVTPTPTATDENAKTSTPTNTGVANTNTPTNTVVADTNTPTFTVVPTETFTDTVEPTTESVGDGSSESGG